MKDLLKDISTKAISRNNASIAAGGKSTDMVFDQMQEEAKWLGYPPATATEIQAAENRLGINLPQDYVEFLKISNGFSQPSFTSCLFFPVEKIEFLRVLDEELIEIYSEDAEPEWANALQSSIVVGGPENLQQFFLIPPTSSSPNWRYWLFANWLAGEHEYASLNAYFGSVLEGL